MTGGFLPAVFWPAPCRLAQSSFVLGNRRDPMLYAIFCYNDEDVVFSWSKEQDEAVMAKLDVVHQKLAKNGKLGPAVRLMPTTAATTIRKDHEPPLVIDGPFAETKEQLLGFYVVDCTSLEHALETAKELGRANPGGSYEIRPLLNFWPGSAGA